MSKEGTGFERSLRVFLCHSSGDKPAIRDLYRRLKQDGFMPWLDEEDLIAGQDWQEVIPHSIRQSQAVIVCLSKQSVTKEGYVQKEIKFALDVADEKPSGTVFLIPACLEELELPARLARWQSVNLFQERGYEKLVVALKARAKDVGINSIQPGSDRSTPTSFQSLSSWELRTLAGHSNAVQSVGITPDGRRVVSGSGDGTVRVWNLNSGQELHVLKGHTSWVNAVAIADNRRAVSASADFTLKVWELPSGRELRTLTDSSSVVCVAVTPDGLRAVSASAECTLKVWDLESGRELRLLKGHSDLVHKVAIIPTGGCVVSASSDKTVRLWDIESGRLLHALEGHSRAVLAVAVTPDGRRIVSGSADKSLKVWDMESGGLLHTLAGHSSQVHSVAITPDSRHAISASSDTTLEIWNLVTGRGLRTLEGHSGIVSGVGVTPDGRRAVSSSWDRTLKVWNIEDLS